MGRFKGLQGSRQELLFLHEVSLLSRFLLGALQIHFNIISLHYSDIIVVFIFFSIIPIFPQYNSSFHFLFHYPTTMDCGMA